MDVNGCFKQEIFLVLLDRKVCGQNKSVVTERKKLLLCEMKFILVQSPVNFKLITSYTQMRVFVFFSQNFKKIVSWWIERKHWSSLASFSLEEKAQNGMQPCLHYFPITIISVLSCTTQLSNLMKIYTKSQFCSLSHSLTCPHSFGCSVHAVC